jgi:hypothetical protein
MIINYSISLKQHKQLWALATEGLTMPVAYPTSIRVSFNSLNGDGGTQV